MSTYLSFGTRLDELTYNDMNDVNVYDIGTWFNAFLIYHEGEETFKVNFWDDLDSLGFDCAFLKNFGLTPTAYVDQFDEFIA